MNPEQLIDIEDALPKVGVTETQEWHVDAEPSNIIRLAERGLLVSEVSERIPDDFSYENYSPLNEW